ncbi:MAG: FAD-dependent oxidoreductase [Oscillospiraceae bacterium]|nr:FAD-dependent oxidoreductase [Oscillospiraceae bacterium]
MSRLEIMTRGKSQQVMEELYNDFGRRLVASPPGICPVDMALSFITLCHSQSCGKCVPCRVGLGTLKDLLESVLDGRATLATIDLIRSTAVAIADSADCAIGYDAARMIVSCVDGFRDDFEEHIEKGLCLGTCELPVPCVFQCPAHVDIPGYIALVKEGRCADAVRLIRKDNPFPVTCGYICEHPCEMHCRRQMIDDAINIRGLKRYAVDNAGVVPVPQNAEPTGKRIAILGGGPCGLSAAYYLALMGHDVTVYERRKKLGGMLRYGIPSYRFPREMLDRDIDAILSTGVKVQYETDIGTDIKLEEIIAGYDSVFISIGAHIDVKANLPGEDLNGVISAVELLRNIGDGAEYDLTGKTVAVIGGGNVAMDVCRTSMRLGAKKVYCVYRRRRVDMTALPIEIEGAVAEGVELITLKAPSRIEGDAEGNACRLWMKPQLPGALDDAGRPRPVNANMPEESIDADLVIMAVGQKIESTIYENAGIPTNRGAIVAMNSGQIFKNDKIFAGGDCATGPATVIRAIAVGKVAAANIDEYLGYHHVIDVDVEIPNARISILSPRGRVNTVDREAGERKGDFECVECGMTTEGATLESSRCLRCDHYGFGVFRGGRIDKW